MIQLYNTLTRKKEPLKTLSPDEVALYTCGLTVYNEPHIGNWVGYIYWDVLVRLLEKRGYHVTHTQNITDVGHLVSDDDNGDDKLQKKADQEKTDAWTIAETYIKLADGQAYTQLGLKRPTHLVRATDYIEQQIAFATALDEKGYLYRTDDGMYFDTSKCETYGELARLDTDGLKAGARVEMSDKKHPTDFAVWKFSPKNTKRDMEWNSPWGVGFPGWHLECSTIAYETLGEQIDIHAGGIDHIPIHHSNEIVQTEARTGKPFSTFWLHNNHLKIGGTKISKSLGNTIYLRDITEKGYDLQAFKLMVLSKQYQTEGNFTWDILDATATRLRHWYDYAALRHQIHDTIDNDDEKDEHDSNLDFLAARQKLVEILSDNLNTPEALAFIDSNFAKLDNKSLDRIHRASFVAFLELIDDLFGLQLLASTPDISDDTKRLIIERERARDAKDWKKSDELRNEITAAGTTIKDTPSGTMWSYTR